MDPAEIIMGHIQGHGRFVVFEFLAETVCQAGKAALLHPQGQIRPLDIRSRNSPPVWLAAHDPALYLYYMGWGIPTGGLFHIKTLIHKALKSGSEVTVLTIVNLKPIRWRGLPVDLIPGLEEGLIRELQPKWNRRGRGALRKQKDSEISN